MSVNNRTHGSILRLRPSRPGPRDPYIKVMPLPAPPTTFAELERQGLELVVTCQKCGHEAAIDASALGIRDRKIAGRRFRCSQPGCGGIGLPTISRRIGNQRRWKARLADHADKLR